MGSSISCWNTVQNPGIAKAENYVWRVTFFKCSPHKYTAWTKSGMESLPACRGRKTPCLPITALIYRDIQFKHGKTNAHTHCRTRAACIWTGGLSLLYLLTLQTPSDNSIQTWIIPYFCYTLVYASLHSNHVSDASSLGGIKYLLICTQRAMGITKGKK